MTAATVACDCPRVRHQHGTITCYIQHRCHCQPCRDANSARARQDRRQKAYGTYQRRYESVVPTQRRLQALARIGWSAVKVAAGTGMSVEVTQRILAADRGLITASNAAKVRRFYTAHENTPAPQTTRGERISAVRTIRAATRNGWLAPAWWDEETITHPDTPAPPTAVTLDEIAIEERLAGRPVNLTKAERVEASRRALARGWSANQVAHRLGTTPRTIERYKAAA